MHKNILLASTSIYRHELLQKLQLPFQTASPEVDEHPLDGERPWQTAERLSLAKAQALSDRYRDTLIIGSDQVAYLGDQCFGKPLTRENAVLQLQSMRGQSVIFHTGLCLYNSSTHLYQLTGVATCVTFRLFTDAEIERYLDKEEPYHCAGSAKSEGLGITLIERIEGSDPNALIGLPLIALCTMLRAEGVPLP